MTEENVFDAYRASASYMRVFFDPLDEFERIARNKPHPNIDPAYPKVTDGTTSSVIQKTPRRIIQQLPTGKVVSDTEDWLSIIASFVYTNKIIPNANDQFALLLKSRMTVKKSLTNGAAHAFTPFVMRGDYFGTDMRVPFVKDVLFEAGKLSDTDSNFIFLRAWYQPMDIKALIHREAKLKSLAESRKEKYESTWDISALEAIKDEVSQKSDDQMSQAEKEKQDQSNKGGIEIIHAFQRGIGSKFYSFHVKSQTIVRTKINKDPRGGIPINSMYADTDGSNPLGWGLVEQVAPLQNLMDSEMQMYQFQRALGLAPPMIKRGLFNKGQIKLMPNVIWDLGQNKDNSIEAVRIDTSALQKFPEIYGLMKSQLLNLAASPDTSISASVGNPGFSKTSAGVNTMRANISVDDNYVRTQFETFFGEWSETAINLYFAERRGTEELQLDKKTAEKLRKLSGFDQSLLSKDNKVRINYDTATPKLKFQVDASTSNMEDNQAQLEAMDGLLERYDKSPSLQRIVPLKKVVNVWNSIVSASGVQDSEKLSVDEEEFAAQEQAQQQAEAEAAQAAQASQPQTVAPAPKAPSESLNYKDAPEDIKRQIEAQAGMEPSKMLSPVQQQNDLKQRQLDQAAANVAAAPQKDTEQQPTDEPEPADQPAPQDELTDEDKQFIMALQQAGYSDDRIGQALAMASHGIPEAQIVEMLEASNG